MDLVLGHASNFTRGFTAFLEAGCHGFGEGIATDYGEISSQATAKFHFPTLSGVPTFDDVYGAARHADDVVACVGANVVDLDDFEVGHVDGEGAFKQADLRTEFVISGQRSGGLQDLTRIGQGNSGIDRDLAAGGAGLAVNGVGGDPFQWFDRDTVHRTFDPVCFTYVG